MNEKEVKDYLEQRGLSWDRFRNWIIGQTVSSDKEGNTIFLTGDVKNYVKEMYSDLSFSGIVNLVQDDEILKKKVLNTLVDLYVEADNKRKKLELEIRRADAEKERLHSAVEHLCKIMEIGPKATYVRGSELVKIETECITIEKILIV